MMRWSVRGAGGLALVAAATGLPLSFLRSGRVAHADSGTNPSFLIMAINGSGDPLNANCPGSYPNPNDDNDTRWQIEHATVDELGTGPIGMIGDEPIGAPDFAEGHLCMLGDQETYASRAYAVLPEGMRANMAVVRHRTYTAAHPEMRKVMEFHGNVKGPGRIGVESFPSFIAQEMGPILGTVISAPMNIGSGTILNMGAPVRRQDPSNLQELFADSGSWRGLSPGQFADYRDAALDDIYREVRDHGTHAQRLFLEAHAKSRADARLLSEALSESLAPVSETDDRALKQMLTATALIEHKVAPVIIVDLDFGGDNHQDSDLSVELTQQIASLDALRTLYVGLEAKGLAGSVTFGYLGVFGRRLTRSAAGGRNHYGDDHAMLMFGPNVEPGYYGTLTEDLKAGPIGDVRIEETLAAAGKTLAAAVGVPKDIIEQRIVGGRVVWG